MDPPVETGHEDPTTKIIGASVSYQKAEYKAHLMADHFQNIVRKTYCLLISFGIW